jgi:hypothetical protein
MDFFFSYLLDVFSISRGRASLHLGTAAFVGVIAYTIFDHVGQGRFAPIAAILGSVAYLITILAKYACRKSK